MPTTHIYTDGSFHEKQRIVSSSAVIPKTRKAISVTIQDDNRLYNSVHAEIIGAYLGAVHYNNNNSHIIIHSDCDFLVNLNKKNRTSIDILMGFNYFKAPFDWRIRYMLDYLKSQDNIQFSKVKSHSGNKWNECADYIANRSARICYPQNSKRRMKKDVFEGQTKYLLSGGDRKKISEFQKKQDKGRTHVWEGVKSYYSLNDMILDFTPNHIAELYG